MHISVNVLAEGTAVIHSYYRTNLLWIRQTKRLWIEQACRQAGRICLGRQQSGSQRGKLHQKQGSYSQTKQTNRQTDRQSGSSQLGKKEDKAHTVPARRPLKKSRQPGMQICCQAGRKTYLAGKQVELEERQTDLADMQNRHSGQGD